MGRSVASRVTEELLKQSDPRKAALLQKFFKTGKGEYGEGDLFLGLTVPEARKIASRFFDSATLEDIDVLLRSKYHEERLVALVLLVQKFRKAKEKQEERDEIVDFYLGNIRHVNNWDLVDISAPNILGMYLFAEKDRSRLYTLARSQNVWSRRISIIATMYFIKNGRFEDTLKISEILLGDGHDLIHKAVGWALREVYKRQPRLVEEFLKMHLRAMPRTTLRYAIEKVPKQKRAKFLKKTPQR